MNRKGLYVHLFQLLLAICLLAPIVQCSPTEKTADTTATESPPYPLQLGSFRSFACPNIPTTHELPCTGAIYFSMGNSDGAGTTVLIWMGNFRNRTNIQRITTNLDTYYDMRQPTLTEIAAFNDKYPNEHRKYVATALGKAWVGQNNFCAMTDQNDCESHLDHYTDGLDEEYWFLVVKK
ncbi:MAG: hypothetical protein AAB568_01610 [Patescibacteria group bacterium]